MSLRYTLVETNSTDVPSAGANTFNRGFNVPGGAVDEIIIRIQGTMNAVGDLAADMGSVIAGLRIVLNGETFFDFRSNFSTNATVGASATSVFLNAMGAGRSVDVNSSTTIRDYFLRIPVGRNIPAGISRLEYTLQYSALGGAFATPSIEWWMRYNPAMQNTVTIGAATSYLSAGAVGGVTEQVVVRVPQNVPGVLAGVMIQGGTAADTMTSARVLSQSDYSIDTDMWRALGGDLRNGILYAQPAAAVAQGLLTFSQKSLGLLFVPLFNLSLADDLRMQITTTGAETFTFTPVIVSAITGAPQAAAVQTQAVPTSVSKSILAVSDAQA
tara:strand:+ start:1101 stop:2084 length:984 start_codon:yes stop_codon:yes gene_type:complete